MGISDVYLANGLYSPFIDNAVDLKNIKSIAWLGWQKENILTKPITSLCSNLETSDMYDVDTGHGAKYWDINKDWNISGYDLVICLRTTCHAADSEHFLKNLKKTIENNGKVIVDFLLPEVKLLSSYNVYRRETLRNALDFPVDVEGYFSWSSPCFAYFGSTPVGIPAPNDMPGDKNVLFRKFGGYDGYMLMPKFDGIYNQYFFKKTGYRYTDKLGFACPANEMLSDTQFDDWGFPNVASLAFDYCLNYLPQEFYVGRLPTSDSPEGRLDPWHEDIFDYPNKNCVTVLCF
tara:strand:+ start:15 stop:884 length:870 start_codon:yes stop_codon:yes gene_type:complete